MNVRMKKIVNTLGIPRLIIIGLLIVILIAMPILGLQIEMLYTQAFGRIGMYMSPSIGMIKFALSVIPLMTGWQSTIHWQLRNWNNGVFSELFLLMVLK